MLFRSTGTHGGDGAGNGEDHTPTPPATPIGGGELPDHNGLTAEQRIQALQAALAALDIGEVVIGTGGE